MTRYEFTEARPGTYQAQFGEDRWLEQFFAGKRDGVFVEVGAYDGKVLSNTYHFEQLGWTGVLVEADPGKAALSRANRPRSRVFECAALADPSVRETTFHVVRGGEAFSTASLTAAHRRRVEGYGLAIDSITVRARTLDSMLEEAGLGAIDFVSIDVEESEPEVLGGFSIARWRPALVLIEENRKIRRRAIRRYFVDNGYAFYEGIGPINHAYVPARLASVVDAFRYWRHMALRALRKLVREVGRRLKRDWHHSHPRSHTSC